MENRRVRNQQMGRSKPDVRCKKHPKHQQSPGVCSICLREKLSRISSSATSRSSFITVAASSCSSSSSSSLSSVSSHYSSSESSPVHYHAKGSISLLKSTTVLTKSRSMAFVARMREGDAKNGNKKGGFWSNLLRPRTNRMDESLVHSRTMRERVITVH